jgi:hypothetical protein
MYFQRLLGLEYHFAFFADELWSVFCLILVFIASGKRESHIQSQYFQHAVLRMP